ncbi:gamma-glutamylcyclotransferase family protein [Paenibacillus hamazuiensis]|uniref:gamma-glutamylcyclotransferase family protein n=1 Tax=Paenibacillus hamazuiensis TaxID=2936508 RepID=UPI00200CB80A|nr:gamma-glutamylcyclotransferase family protein [Paenibacillus hamazuiensis]
MVNVFVYGTLLTGESNHRIAAPYVYAVKPGAIRGTLYDVGPYPALVLDAEGSRIDGEWLTVTPDGLAEMDELESYYGPGETNEYERVWVQDIEDGSKEGWVYVYTDSRGLPRIREGSWREYRRGRGAVQS